MPVPSPRADEHLENWLSYKQGNEGRSVATVHKYRVWILRLKDWRAPANPSNAESTPGICAPWRQNGLRCPVYNSASFRGVHQHAGKAQAFFSVEVWIHPDISTQPTDYAGCSVHRFPQICCGRPKNLWAFF